MTNLIIVTLLMITEVDKRMPYYPRAVHIVSQELAKVLYCMEKGMKVSDWVQVDNNWF